MKRDAFAGVLACVLGLSALGFFGWRYVAARGDHICLACSRPVHGHTNTIAVIDGKRGHYCCPACALSEHQQASKPVQIVQLTDYLEGTALTPAGTYLVRNSDVNPCARHEAALTPDKQPMHAHFDRCSPSLLAFGDRKAAEVFASEHGGQVLPFAEMASQFQR